MPNREFNNLPKTVQDSPSFGLIGTEADDSRGDYFSQEQFLNAAVLQVNAAVTKTGRHIYARTTLAAETIDGFAQIAKVAGTGTPAYQIVQIQKRGEVSFVAGTENAGVIAVGASIQPSAAVAGAVQSLAISANPRWKVLVATAAPGDIGIAYRD